MRERGVVPCDVHHRLVGFDAVAVEERMHFERIEVGRAELENRDRLVHATEPRVLFLEDLHHDAGPALVP